MKRIGIVLTLIITLLILINSFLYIKSVSGIYSNDTYWGDATFNTEGEHWHESIDPDGEPSREDPKPVQSSNGDRLDMQIDETYKYPDLNLSLQEQIIHSTELTIEEKIQRTAELKAQKLIDKNYLVKLIASLIFMLAALFVILSKKYDEQTKKWAIGVLTLIAGVWIGTVT